MNHKIMNNSISWWYIMIMIILMMYWPSQQTLNLNWHFRDRNNINQRYRYISTTLRDSCQSVPNRSLSFCHFITIIATFGRNLHLLISDMTDGSIHHGCFMMTRSRLGCVVSSQIGGVWCWICVGSREVCHEFFGLGMLPEDDAEVILLESVEFNRKHQLEWYVVLWVCFKHGGAVQFDKWNYSTVVVDFERSSWSFHLCIYDFKLDL